MNIDKRWFLLLAVAVGALTSATVAVNARRRHHRTVRDLEHKHEMTKWENEGGNLAPIPAALALP